MNRAQSVEDFSDSIDVRKTKNARMDRCQVIQRLSDSIVLHDAI
jgi:hypothetical protein